MTSPTHGELEHWNPGPTRDAIVEFLDKSDMIEPINRVAMMDNDGTLWCERPHYNQFEFIVWATKRRLAEDPNFKLSDDMRKLASGASQIPSDMDQNDVAHALNDAFFGLTPAQYTALAHTFAQEWKHSDHGALRNLRYVAMLELLTALRRRGFDVFVATGGGIEFVRSIANDFYGVTPERVVGSMVSYDYDVKSRVITRNHDLVGAPNEGVEKVTRIQQMVGRRPVFAAGNSAGDTEMLDYALASDGPTMSLLINHDDADREYAYKSVAATLSDARDIVDVGRQSGWTIVSMKDDWAKIFEA